MDAGRKAGAVTTRPHPLQHLSLAWRGRLGQSFPRQAVSDERFREGRGGSRAFVGRRDGFGISGASAHGVWAIGYLLCSRMYSSMEGQQVVAHFAVCDAGRTMPRSPCGAGRRLNLVVRRRSEFEYLLSQGCLTARVGGVTLQPTSAHFWEFGPLRVGQGLRRGGCAAAGSGPLVAVPMVFSGNVSPPRFQHLILRQNNSSLLLEVSSLIGKKSASTHARN